MSRLFSWLRRMVRGTLAVTDLSRYPLPLYLRHSAGLPPPEPPRVVACSACGVRYFERPAGSHLPEDGRCRACVTGATRPAARPEQVESMFRRQRRLGGWRR